MKLALLDKDGTLVKPKSSNTFVQSPDDQELLLGVAERIDEMAKDGWQFCIVSNQGGVGTHKTLDEAIAEMRYCLSLMRPIIGPTVRDMSAYFCPDGGQTCIQVRGDVAYYPPLTHKPPLGVNKCFRKPDPGMVEKAILNHKPMFIDFGKTENFWHQSNCIFIGDRPEDEQCASNAGIRFIHADEWRSKEWKL